MYCSAVACSSFAREVVLVVLTKGEPALSEMEGTQPEEARPSRFLYTSFVRVSV